MPLYPYRCPKCNQVHEQIHKHEDDPEPCETPGCGHQLTKEDRMLTRAAFQFQAGEGWGGWKETSPDILQRVRD